MPPELCPHPVGEGGHRLVHGDEDAGHPGVDLEPNRGTSRYLVLQHGGDHEQETPRFTGYMEDEITFTLLSNRSGVRSAERKSANGGREEKCYV